MSTTRIITIVCWVVSIIVLSGLAIWFITGTIFGIGGFNMGNGWVSGINIDGIGGFESLSGPYESQGTQTIDSTGLNTIDINWVAGEITVIPHDGNEIRVTEFAQRQLRDRETLTASTSGGTLTIRFRERGNFSRRMPRKNLEVLVPHELSESLTRLSVSTTSGQVNVNDFEATTLNISSVSASIDVTNITSQTVNINTTSGAITATSIRADKLDASSVSGNFTLTETYASTLDLSTTSGRTNASGEFDRVGASTVSGNINIRSTIAPSRFNSSSVSGDIELHIPIQETITVSHSAVSGRFSSEVPVTMQSGAAYSFSSVSGNTNIYAIG